MSTFSLSLEEADRIVAQLQTTPHKDQPRAPSQASLLPEEEITAILDSIVTPPPTKHIQQSPAGKKPKLSHVPLHIESPLVQLVRRVCTITYPPNARPLFKFENTVQAADFNTKILESFHFDAAKAMSAVKNTILQPGAEFRPLRDLEPLFHHHIDWEKFVTLCTVGAEYCFKDNLEYSEERRLDDLRHAIERGNNKSALDPEDAPFIQKNQTKEVEKGWMIPIRKDSVLKIPGAGVIPLGIAEQITIDAQGNRIPKKRFTHDLSRPMKSGMSVNNMIDDDKLDPCLFGHCLLRLLHRIQKLRLRHGWTPILSSKIDLDAAFRRLHMSYPHALLSIVIVEQIAYLLGRMTFGSKIGPGKHDIPSNMVVDLAQMLLDDPSWDPATLHSPDADKIPLKETLTGDIPFGQAFPWLCRSTTATTMWMVMSMIFVQSA